MTVLWSRENNGRRVEVRSAGRSRRLYADGVLHSLYHPERSLSCGLWDQLALAAYLLPSQSIRRVLVLGVGGGTAVHLLHQFFQPERIEAVEMDELLLWVGKNWFDLNTVPSLNLHHADAREWLRCYRGAPFDMIIEDCCGEANGQPVRPPLWDTASLETLTGHLAHQGLLVVNYLDLAELRASPLLHSRLGHRFDSIIRFSRASIHNQVTAFCPQPTSPQAFWAAVRRHPTLRKAHARGQLAFSLHRVR